MCDVNYKQVQDDILLGVGRGTGCNTEVLEAKTEGGHGGRGYITRPIFFSFVSCVATDIYLLADYELIKCLQFSGSGCG